MNKPFEIALDRMNRIKSVAHGVYWMLSILRAAAVALLVTALWMDVDPSTPLLHFLIGIVTFSAVIRFSSLGRTHKINSKSMLLALDMQHPNTNLSPFIAADLNEETSEWTPRLQREEKRLRAWEYRRLTTLAGSLLVPSLVALLLVSKAPLNVSSALADVKNVLSALTGGMTLEVVSGAAPTKKSEDKNIFSLSSNSPPTIELIPSNMLKLTLVRVDSSEVAPVVMLKSEGNIAPLSMQMSIGGTGTDSSNVWVLEFSAPEKSDLVLPSYSDKPIAHLQVQELPIPKVQMNIATGARDPWPDQELIPLTIHVQAHHPLEKIRLKIVAKGKTSEESVLNISGDTTTVNTTYHLNIQPWMEEDIVELEIVAEATDRADPVPLVGKSVPIHVKAASAYGRYKAVLESLKQVKTSIDDSRSSAKTISEEVRKQMADILIKSQDTPFFDGLDRMELAKLEQQVSAAITQPSLAKTQEVSDDMGQFLLEHEILDDRERDRDLFIAIRSYSRVLDRQGPERVTGSKYMSDKMQEFLTERMKRWSIRVARLGPSFEPASWSKILKEKPFQDAVRITHKDAELAPKKSQGYLSKLATDYKLWIDELEAKEDQARAKQEQERQQGLANARNDLREIQQRQDQISSNLDKSNEKSPDELAQKWPASRLNENSNVKQSTSLLAKLRALSPKAGDRLEAAIDAMNTTLEDGEQGKWAESEGNSDLAGRLLRDADQAASKSQKQKDRGRRRKTGGDDYHGNSIGGQIEIKSEYRVDPKYREEILRDVDQEGSSGENKGILDGWLRQVVR